MTDDDKALVERLWNRVEYRWDGQTQIREIDTDATYAAHRIEELSAENERLREALLQMKRIPNYIRKDDNRKEMLKIINAALGETK